MPDANWFFSTLAQSTAALIGMLGGMLVVRLMDYKQSDQLVESKRDLDRRLGVWRHNVLATSLNATRRTGEPKNKEVLQEIYRLAEREEPYTGFKRYRRLCDELLQHTFLLPQGTLADEANEVKQTQIDIQVLQNCLSSEKDQIIALWERHDTRLHPMSIYVMFVVLVALGGVGVIVPLIFLTGFHRGLFYLFIIGYVSLCLCIAWFLVDLVKTNRIRPERDSSFLPYYKATSENVTPFLPI